MKSLVIAEAFPWPTDDGYRLRLANLLGAFLELGEVDFLCLDGRRRTRDHAPEGVTVIDAPGGPDRAISSWLRPWLTGSDPRRLLRSDFSEGRRRLETLEQSNYDVCFVSHVDCWYPIEDLLTIPTIVDFDNLENLLTRTIREAGPIIEPGASVRRRVAASARWVVASAFNLVDERRWDSVQRRLANSVDLAFVCSSLDVERSGYPNTVVVPNGYERTFEPADHVELNDSTAPVFLFVGLMSYDPNSDAVRRFASAVMPRIRRELPGARFRIVGRNPESVASLERLDGVEVVGAVDSLEAELRGADVAVVPLRAGAGTRLKVVEAMANRLPMVTTSIGCEGIDIVDGVHAWIRDDDEGIAEACIEAVRNIDARRSVIDAAEARYEERYRWESIRSSVASMASSVASEGLRRS